MDSLTLLPSRASRVLFTGCEVYRRSSPCYPYKKKVMGSLPEGGFQQ